MRRQEPAIKDVVGNKEEVDVNNLNKFDVLQ